MKAFNQTPTPALQELMQEVFQNRKEVNIVDIYCKSTATADYEVTLWTLEDGKRKRYKGVTDAICESMPNESETLVTTVLEFFKKEIINQIN